MMTEKEISKKISRNIKSPIRIGNVKHLGFDIAEFLNFFQPFFESLSDDTYLVRENQITFLKTKFPLQHNMIQKNYGSFFEGKTDIKIFESLLKKLTKKEYEEFRKLSIVTRQRSISKFVIEIWDDEFFIERITDQQFRQNVSDFRALKRVFTQSKNEAVNNKLFAKLLEEVTAIVKEIHPEIRKIQITSHFMRTISYESILGENAPEGIHEDGSQYIMSALVVNRHNISGGESQIFEKVSKNDNEVLFKKALEPGEFIFQADTGEEATFGNDLWHYVTPIQPIGNEKEGIRDIIGFDIDILA